MIYEKKMNIGYSTIGKQGVLKIVSIMNFLQDAASEHAACMGISGFDLAKENLAWVISRYHIEIKSHPAWQDKIIIKTDRFSCKNLYEIRSFTITLDEANKIMETIPPDYGEERSIRTDLSSEREDKAIRETQEKLLLNAMVCWVMVNKKNGRPVRLSRFTNKEMYDTADSIESGLYQSGENSGSLQSGRGLESYFKELIKPGKIHYQLPFKVRMHDLDLNGHVNNAIFVEWGVETVPEEILSRFYPATIDVMFIRESLYGDIIISHTEIGEISGIPVTFHSIIRQQDQTELARLNICWHPLEQSSLLFPI